MDKEHQDKVDKKQTESKQSCCTDKSSQNKGWLMMLCCAAPLLLLFALPLFGIQSSSITYLAVLACPLGMLLMSIMMNKKEGSCHEEGKNR